MKVGILTHYDVNNQGAVLQMYALCQYLKQIKCQPFVLTYHKNFDFADENTRKKYHIGPSSYPYFFKQYLLAQGPGITLFNVRKNRVLSEFRKRNFTLKPYATFQTDAVLIGSDEVFSIPVGVNPMMYGHGVRTDALVAYAPSFGQTDIQDMDRYHCRGLIASGLAQFSALSARDAHTQRLIMELSGRNAPIVCDPVFLYEFPVHDLKPSAKQKPYVLVYSYDKNMNQEDEINGIRRYARTHGYKTISAGTYHKWCDRNITCDPLEWLDYFRKAQCCVVDTYHGVIAAAVCNCPMAIKIRGINQNKLSFLVEQLGLASRVIENMESDLVNVLDRPLDFTSVQQKIEMLRQKGRQFLSEHLLPGGDCP